MNALVLAVMLATLAAENEPVAIAATLSVRR